MHLFFSDFSQRICFGTIFAWFTKFSKLFHLFLRIFVFLKLTFSLWFLTIIFLGNFYVRMIFAPFLSKLNVFAHFFSMIVLNAHFFDNIFAHFFSRQDKPPPPPRCAGSQLVWWREMVLWLVVGRQWGQPCWGRLAQFSANLCDAHIPIGASLWRRGRGVAEAQFLGGWIGDPSNCWLYPVPV